VDANGNPLEGGGREQDMIEQGYPKSLIEYAKEKFPYEPNVPEEQKEETQEIQSAKQKVSVIMPEQNKTSEIVELIKPFQERSTEAVSVDEETGNGGEVVEGLSESKESTKEGESKSEEEIAPPISEPPKGKPIIHAEPPAIELSYSGLQNIANEFSLPDIEKRDRKSDLKLRTDANNTVTEWAEKGMYAKNIEELIQKAEKGEVLTDEERVILEGHLANVAEEARSLDVKSKEFNEKF